MVQPTGTAAPLVLRFCWGIPMGWWTIAYSCIVKCVKSLVLVTGANCGRIRGAEKGKSELTMTVETFDLENHENVEKVKLKPISFFGGMGWFWEKFSQSPSCEEGYK